MRCLLLVAVASLSLVACDGRPASKNLVLITIDTLRTDRLGCYGGPNATSPNIDRLAAEGTLFEDAYTPRGLTLPAMTSFFTSRYPIEHGVLTNQSPVQDDEVMLAEVLESAGFRTRAWVANGILCLDHNRFRQGFPAGHFSFERDEAKMTAEAVRHLKSGFGREQREFLWLHYISPHRPYEPPAPYATMFDPAYDGPYDGSKEALDRIFIEKIPLEERDLRHILAVYDGTIRFVDDLIGQVLQALAESGVERETLVVFNADHGEDLYSHNFYFYHSNSIYRSSTQVPLILRQAGRVPADRRVQGMVENVDFMPTLLALLAVPPERIAGRERWRGDDLTPVIDGGGVQKRYAFAQWGDRVFSIRDREWMYLSNPEDVQPRSPPFEGAYPIGREELYRVAVDPDEQSNVAAAHPEKAREMQAALTEFLEGLVRAGEESGMPLGSEDLDTLRSLGYVGGPDG